MRMDALECLYLFIYFPFRFPRLCERTLETQLTGPLSASGCDVTHIAALWFRFYCWATSINYQNATGYQEGDKPYLHGLINELSDGFLVAISVQSCFCVHGIMAIHSMPPVACGRVIPGRCETCLCLAFADDQGQRVKGK